MDPSRRAKLPVPSFDCLLCRTTRREKFTSCEHPVPQGLGNTTKVLPKGVVCDVCNHGVGSRLDAALLNFNPIATLRALAETPTKRGNLPRIKFDKGEMHGRTFIPSPSLGRRDRDLLARGGFPSLRRGDHADADLALIYRALIKCAFETAWLDHGDLLYSRRFAHLRRLVLGERCRGYLLTQAQATPRLDQFSLEYQLLPEQRPQWPRGCHMWILMDYFGQRVGVCTRLVSRPVYLDSSIALSAFDV